jgi:hypothetical protein
VPRLFGNGTLSLAQRNRVGGSAGREWSLTITTWRARDPGAIVWHEHGMVYGLLWQLPPGATEVPSTASLLRLATSLRPVSG